MKKKSLNETPVRPRTVRPNLGKFIQSLFSVKGIFQTSRQPLVNARLLINYFFSPRLLAGEYISIQIAPAISNKNPWLPELRLT